MTGGLTMNKEQIYADIKLILGKLEMLKRSAKKLLSDYQETVKKEVIK